MSSETIAIKQEIDEACRYSSFISTSNNISNGNLQLKNNLGLQINISKSIKDLDSNKIRLYQEIYLYSIENKSFIDILANNTRLEVIKPLFSSLSPSKNITLTINQIEKKQYIEITSIDNVNRIDTSKIHGDICQDSWFGGGSWSKDENYFVYVAKPIDSKTKSIFGYDSILTSNDYNNYNHYEYQEDWGEKFEGISSTVIVILNVTNGIIKTLPNDVFTDNILGQPTFVSTSNINYSLVMTSWSTKPRRLGMIYCYQRSCQLLYVNVTDFVKSSSNSIEYKTLTSSLYLARSPRFDNQSNSLVFIGRKEKMASHNGCMELYYIPNFNDDICELNIVCLVPLVNHFHDFPGLYLDLLPNKCFVDNFIILNSVWCSRDVILSIDIKSNEIKILSNKFYNSTTISHWNNKHDYSYQVLDIIDNYLLIRESSPSSPHTFGIFDIASQSYHTYSNTSPVISSSYQISSNLVSKFNDNLIFKIFPYSNNNILYESIVLLPKDKLSNIESIPLVIVPHGGPHSCLTVSYYTSYSYLMSSLNCGLVLINFRGSTGFGEDSILSLLGKIGTNDVCDIYTITSHMLSLTYNDLSDFDINYTDTTSSELTTKIFDSNKIGIVGGSHGGFLTAHMIGQYPDLFQAACMRNPVTNIPSMFTTSDIPDWCMIESGLTYDFDSFILPNIEQIKVLQQCSPVIYIDKVKTPTLICLGLKDKRVPPSQGTEYYHLLKCRNIDSKLVTYPEDCHAIDKPSTEAEHWIEIAKWLKKYLG